MIESDNKQLSPRLNLVVAHALEARPLLAPLGLESVQVKPYQVYSNKQGLSLILSGNGKLASAAATAYLAGLQGEKVAPAWLNIGIAGHGEKTLGSAVLINRITDVLTGNVYYPTPMPSTFESGALHTVESVERNYSDAVAYDMEGSAFWATASRVGKLDLVHCIKIVSDNPQQGVETFKESGVQALIENRLADIKSFIAGLSHAADELNQAHALPDCYELLINQYHFTHTQQKQLQRLLQRWQVCKEAAQLQRLLDQQYTDTRALLQTLENALSPTS